MPSEVNRGDGNNSHFELFLSFWSSSLDRTPTYDGEENCCSLSGRCKSAGSFLVSAILIPLMPIVIVASVILGLNANVTAQNPNAEKLQEYWKNHRFVMILDIAATAITSPLHSLLFTIKCLAGAVIHPGIVYS